MNNHRYLQSNGRERTWHCFGQAVIANAVWRYFRFPFSLRLVEDTLLGRGIAIPMRTIRCWEVRAGLRRPIAAQTVSAPAMSVRSQTPAEIAKAD